MWTEGRVSLRAALNKSAYGHGEHISVTIDVRNDSRKIIRKIRVSICKIVFYYSVVPLLPWHNVRGRVCMLSESGVLCTVVYCLIMRHVMDCMHLCYLLRVISLEQCSPNGWGWRWASVWYELWNETQKLLKKCDWASEETLLCLQT